MSWLWLAGVLLVLWLLLLIRVGVAVSYNSDALQVKLRIGRLSVPVYPGKEPKREAESQPKQEKAPKKTKSIKRYFPFVPCALKAVRRVLKATRIDKLDISLCVGSSDPADAAELYGRLNAAVGSVWGPFHQLVDVKDAKVHLDVDMEADRSTALGQVNVSWRLSELFSVIFFFGWDVLRVALRDRTRHKQEGMVA